MSRIITRLTLLTFLLILSAPPVIADTAEANKFMLLYSNNVNGETEPCG